MTGIEGTRLYDHMKRRYTLPGMDTLEKRVMGLYQRLYTGRLWNEMLVWLRDEITIDELLIEFNEHELMELLQVCKE